MPRMDTTITACKIHSIHSNYNGTSDKSGHEVSTSADPRNHPNEIFVTSRHICRPPMWLGRTFDHRKSILLELIVDIVDERTIP